MTLYENPAGPIVPASTPPPGKLPWLRDQENWAMTTLAREHNDALYQWGEYSMFVLLWSARDFDAGLVERCPVCYVAYGKIAEAYGQTAKSDCPDCYGTTFEGGHRAKIIRPALWADTDEQDEIEQRRGTHVTDRATIQSTTDFVLRNRDLVFRADGTRWQVSAPDAESVTTGFHTKGHKDSSVGLTSATVTREDEASVAYDIPPTTPQLIATLDVAYQRRPTYVWPEEEIVGPLW